MWKVPRQRGQDTKYPAIEASFVTGNTQYGQWTTIIGVFLGNPPEISRKLTHGRGSGERHCNLVLAEINL